MLKSMPMTRRHTHASTVLRDFTHTLARHHKVNELVAEHAQAAQTFERDATEENLNRMRAIENELKSMTGAEAGPPDAF